ncbi:MAG: GNAT family N-acetyltransferase [Gaiellales bacterium]
MTAPRTELRAFAETDVEDAGRLLAARHRRHREASPALDPAFEDGAAAAAQVEDAWRAPAASGAVATRGGELVGFVLGSRKHDAFWGPNVWVESAGHAATEPELVRDLYALAAARWAEEGRTRHTVLVPADDLALVDAWFRLGFGAVFPEARGRGVGAALAHEVFRYAGRERYPTVAVDWRMTNLLASRAWPQLGFRPTFYRLHRSL